jgi:hypothetical protein
MGGRGRLPLFEEVDGVDLLLQSTGLAARTKDKRLLLVRAGT